MMGSMDDGLTRMGGGWMMDLCLSSRALKTLARSSALI